VTICVTLQVVALIESLSSVTSQDASTQEADIQQALVSLSAQQPLSLELHGKLAKAALQAGATTAAMQAATALVAAALPQGRAAQDIVDPVDAPGVAAGDWPWLSVASLVLGQASVTRLCTGCTQGLPPVLSIGAGTDVITPQLCYRCHNTACLSSRTGLLPTRVAR